jgi:hypothetical protein
MGASIGEEKENASTAEENDQRRIKDAMRVLLLCDVGKFFRAMFSELGSGLSGPASVPLAIAALGVSNPVQKFLYGSLTAVLWFFSAYRIWFKEYQRAETELARHTRPEIVLEFLDCLWGTISPQENMIRTHLFVRLRLTNMAAVETTISKYHLMVAVDGMLKEGEAYEQWPRGVIEHNRAGDPFALGLPGNSPLPFDFISDRIKYISPLKRGLPVEGWICAYVDIHHINAFDSFDAEVTVTATDSFHVSHTSKPTKMRINYGHYRRN